MKLILENMQEKYKFILAESGNYKATRLTEASKASFAVKIQNSVQTLLDLNISKILPELQKISGLTEKQQKMIKAVEGLDTMANELKVSINEVEKLEDINDEDTKKEIIQFSANLDKV